MKKILSLICFLLYVVTVLQAQINTGILPESFKNNITRRSLATLTIPAPDLMQLKSSNVEHEKNGTALYVGKTIDISASPSTHGNWIKTNNGKDIWRLSISSDGALGCMLYFDKFELPQGSSFFVYNPDGSVIFGPYTHQDNPYQVEFAIGMVYGQEAILEYVAPQDQSTRVNGNIQMPNIELTAYSYVFRDVMDLRAQNNYGDSENCEVNVNCSEGDNWREQQKGVAKILTRDSGGSYYCTGSLINNTANDGTPYFLTADHCGGETTTNYFNQWVFYFNYESAECTNAQPTNTASITGCVRKARGALNAGSDFLLLELNTTPERIAEIGAVYNGWDKTTTASASGVGIHHPSGDIKKISTYTKPLTSTNYIGDGEVGAIGAHWSVAWAATTNGHGVTEGGSSGSPIFNQSGLIVGTLSGGSSYCNYTRGTDLYGKMSYHWESNGTTDAAQLKSWLDPANSDTDACPLFNPNARVAKPIFTPGAGTYGVGQAVTLTSTTEGTNIYYTLDGSTPDKNSALYTQAIVLNESKTINAVAYHTTLESSIVASSEYIITSEPTIKVTENALSFSRTNIVQQIVLSSCNLTDDISVTTTEGFSLSAQSIAPNTLDNVIVVTFIGTETTIGTLTLTSGSVQVTITLTATIVDNLLCNDSFEEWTDSKPNCWFGEKTNITSANIAQSTSSRTGDYAMQLKNTTNTHKRFTSGTFDVVEGVAYDITYWVKGRGEIRIGLYDNRTTGSGYAYNDYHIVNSTTYVQYTDQITADNTTSEAEFVFSVKNTAANDHLILDNVVVLPTSDGTQLPIVQQNSFAIYPNPAADFIQILSEESANIVIFDISGRIMKAEHKDNENAIVFVGDLATGVYYVRLGDKVQKFIKK